MWPQFKQHFTTKLALASSEKPLVVIIDGVDKLDDKYGIRRRHSTEEGITSIDALMHTTHSQVSQNCELWKPSIGRERGREREGREFHYTFMHFPSFFVSSANSLWPIHLLSLFSTACKEDLSWLPIGGMLPPYVRVFVSFTCEPGNTIIWDNMKR